MKFCFASLCCCAFLSLGAGCTGIDKLPAGAQLQSSTFGLRLSPQPLDGIPIVIGSQHRNAG